MKKIILTLVAILAFSFAEAQSKDVTFGIKGGVQFTNYSGDFADDDGGATGFYVGGLVDFHITPMFHIQPELLYSMEGSENGGVSYMRIPIMAKIYVSKAFTIQAGPEVAFKVAAEDDFTDEVVKSTDFGIGIGAGYELPSGLMFDARYNLGLSNISEVEGADFKNTGFQIGLGYRF